MKKLIPAILCIILAAPGFSLAEHRPFDILADAVVSYFTPMKGTVLSTQLPDITTNLGVTEGLKPGMRLLVLRGGEAFIHPITGERIGQAETPVGVAEAVSVNESGATLKVISGEADAGDILRVSSAPVRLLYFQSADVDWGLAEEFFNRLENTGRFDLLETAPGEPVDSAVLAEARRLDAEAALVLTQSGTAANPVLSQRVLWVEGSSELMAGEVLVSEGTVRESRLGEEYFAPNLNKPSLGFVLPHTGVLMATSDLDGNGDKELIFSSGATIRAYSFGATLTPTLKGIELETNLSRTHLWLEAYDLNADGRDELIVSSTNGEDAHSYVYHYNDTEFELLWEDDVFARVVNGRLYAQHSAPRGGFTGDVYPVTWKANEGQNQEPLKLPKGTNIYDFQYFTLADGTRAVAAFDEIRKLSVYMADGSVIWRSKETYGFPAKTFGEREVTDMFEREKWGAGDRMLQIGRNLLAIKRTPMSESAPGFGNASARVVSISPDAPDAEETALVDDLPGGTVDIAVLDQKLLVLANTMTVNPLKLVKGRGMFNSKVYIYPLTGK